MSMQLYNPTDDRRLGCISELEREHCSMTEQANNELQVLDGQLISEHIPNDLAVLRFVSRPLGFPTVRICAVGDIGLSGRMANTIFRCGTDSLFSEVAPLLLTADISFGNLETSLGGDIAPDKMFVAPAAGAIGLRKAGFNLLHLANNHVQDCGQSGLKATLRIVRANGMTPLGAGDDLVSAVQPTRTDIRGLRIAWLGCGRTLTPQNNTGPRYWEFNEAELLTAIAQTRHSVDLLIVSIHIGQMYLDYPRPEDKVMAERLMRSGADLVLMHHAHVLQGIEITPKGQICCYNLGNFVWDCEEGNVKTPVMLEEQNEGAIFLFDLDKHGIAAAYAVPTWIDENCCVRWASGNRGRRILERLKRISLELDGNFESLYRRQRAFRNTAHILQVLAFHTRHGNWRFVADSLRRTRWEHVRMVGRWFTGLGKGQQTK